MILLGIGGLLLIVGSLWAQVFPVSKANWSSSFVLVSAGWANLVLALIYYLSDVRKIKFGSIFRYAGTNAITIFFLAGFIGRLMGSIKVDGENSIHTWLFQNIYVHDFISLKMSSFLYAFTVMCFYLLLAYIMFRKKIIIKV